MTKKDYIMIAKVLRAGEKTFSDDIKNYKIADREYALNKGSSEAIKMLVEAFAEVLKQDNPRFDSIRFTDECKNY